jgi:hypothetical protein
MSCPVCFGAVEPSVRESMNIGILVLLGVTVGVLGCFARFFVALARRSRAAAHLVGVPANEAGAGRGVTLHPDRTGSAAYERQELPV